MTRNYTHAIFTKFDEKVASRRQKFCVADACFVYLSAILFCVSATKVVDVFLVSATDVGDVYRRVRTSGYGRKNVWDGLR